MFRQERFPYAVAYGAALGDEWVVDSHQPGRGGVPGRYKGGADLVDVRIDLDGDGALETAERAPVSDLRLRHRSRDAVIWTRTLVVPPQHENRVLGALAGAYLESTAPAGPLAADFQPRDPTAPVRWTARVLDTLPMSVDGREAHGVLVDASFLGPFGASRPTRVALVFVRTSHVWEDADLGYRRTWPVVLVAGYMTDAESFEGGWDHFARFLGQVRIMPAEE